jgi:hypothetical protein
MVRDQVLKRSRVPGGSASTRAQDVELSVHILSVSAALVGVCLTVIGVLQVVPRPLGLHGMTDNVLATDAVLFLLACLFAYGSLRSGSASRRRALEQVADGCFLWALVVMTCVAGAIAFELTEHGESAPSISATNRGPSSPCTTWPPLRMTARATPT